MAKTRKKDLIWVLVKSVPLDDQYECDADRTPIMIINSNADALCSYCEDDMDLWYCEHMGQELIHVEDEEDLLNLLIKYGLTN